MIILITSVKNVKVKEWRKLKLKKERDALNAFLIEGTHLVEEAYASDWEIIEIIYEESYPLPEWANSYTTHEVTDNVFLSITDTKTPQGIAAIVRKKTVSTMRGNRHLLLDSIQDPGNLGTIIRTADAVGFDTVVLGKGTVDLYNDKVIRSTQGSLFHLNIMEGDLPSYISQFKEAGCEIWATSLDNAEYYTKLEVPEKLALILGNEGAGVSPSILEQATRNVKIPMYGKAESLNVSVAAGVLMYHIANATIE